MAGVTNQFTGLRPERIREHLEKVRERIAAAGRDPAEVEILAATKYVRVDELPALLEGGVTLVGENRAQDRSPSASATRATSPGTSSARSRAAK